MLGTNKSSNSAKRAVTNGHDEMAALREDIETLRKDLSSLAYRALDTGADGVEQLKGMAEEKLSALRGYSTAGLKKAEDTVREKPGQSLAVAFVAGIIINALLFRK
jgi:ElaB/YqjD/DUF883 family membrane-anchored ribosome-binding protein